MRRCSLRTDCAATDVAARSWRNLKNSSYESGPMNERLATLTAARARMIEDRDPFAKVLAGPPDRDKSERARSKFVELQTLIEAIERAIEGERRSGAPAQ